MKRILLSIIIFTFSFFIFHSFAQPSSNHYAALEGKSGQALFDAIHNAAGQGYQSLGYAGLWTAFRTTDLRPDGKIWDMYGTDDCNFTYSSDQCGNYSGECDCYNREHSVPKSWFGGSTANEGCDIFHLVPTDGYVNGRRGNDPFGEVGNATYTSRNGSKLGTSSMPGYSGTVFEPIDEYKGDFARGYLGAMIKWTKDWTKAEGSSTFNNNYTAASNFGLTDYGVELLMKWHRQDPVSQKEIDRNNGIEATQGNRNPFIDYPCLAEYIWGTKKGQVLHLQDLMSVYDAQYMASEDKSGCNCTSITPDPDPEPEPEPEPDPEPEPEPDGLYLVTNYSIQVVQNVLTLNLEHPARVRVFDILGRQYADEPTNALTLTLEKGLYIVTIGKATEKVLVK